MKVFADDTKLWKKITNPNDCEELQSDLDKVYEWTQRWLLKLNIAKCKCMNMANYSKSKDTIKYEYTMGEQDEKIPLENIEQEKDLGVVITKNLQPL